MNNGQSGSVWRRWDLHLHTPGTKLSNNFRCDKGGNVWKKYSQIIEESTVQVFGITDYFSCDSYYKFLSEHETHFPNSTKVFFLNVELRLSDAISPNSSNPHLHIIFDNDENKCRRRDIERFLTNLKTQGENASGTRISCSDLKTKSDFESASVAFEDVRKALRETFGEEKLYLLGFPAKNDGVRSTDMNSPRKILISDKIDKGCDLFFGNSDSTLHFLRTDRYEFGDSAPKPVVSGCDAHSFEDLVRLEGNDANFQPTWIKANPTFRGLMQICFEPRFRIYIGEEPTVEKRKRLQPTKIITSLEVTSTSGYTGSNGTWFENVDIKLNPELTAIIGNKGSGKSALVDIIGLLGESRQEKHFSFLADDQKKRKFRRPGFAENFEAKCIWESQKTISKNLSNFVDSSKPELVRYLPQFF